MATEFTVRGSHTVFHAPERGTAQVTLSFSGPEPQPVYERVVQDLDAVKASVAELHDPANGPVTWWSTQHIRTWAERPWNQDGKQLPLVHHASVGVQVKFSDFARLATWIGALVGNVQGFRLDGVVWALTEANRIELEKTVRTKAVQDAARRAQEYADALGLGSVRPLAVADAGMLSQGIMPQNTAPAAFQRMAMAKDSGGAVELELLPEDIEISSEVDARFVTD